MDHLKKQVRKTAFVTRRDLRINPNTEIKIDFCLWALLLVAVAATEFLSNNVNDYMNQQAKIVFLILIILIFRLNFAKTWIDNYKEVYNYSYRLTLWDEYVRTSIMSVLLDFTILFLVLFWVEPSVSLVRSYIGLSVFILVVIFNYLRMKIKTK